MAKKRSPKKRSSKSTRKAPRTSAETFEFVPGFWRTYWKEALALLLLGVSLYIMSVGFTFVLDDQIVITKNEYTKKGLNGIPDIFSTESFQGYFGEQKNLVAGARYRPLSIATFATEVELFGINSKVMHLVNVLLYGLTALLVFRISALLFQRHRNSALKNKSKWFVALPFLIGLFFVTHPVHSEVVANIKGRDEILAFIGSMGVLYAVMRYLAKGSLTWLVLSGIFMFLGLMAKENAITFLAIIPLTLYFFTKGTSVRQYLFSLLPSLIALVAYLVIRYNVIGYLLDSGKPITDLLNNPFLEMNVSEKYATITYTLGLYVKLLLFPHPLTHDYYPYQIPIMQWTDIRTIFSLLVYGGLAFLAIKLGIKRSPIAYGILFFGATLSIASNIVFPIGTFMNERFLYFPSFGYCLVLAWLLHQGFSAQRSWLRSASLGLTVLIIAGFVVKTITRVPAWKNGLSLNSAAIKVSKNSARANCFMGTALYQEVQKMDLNDSSRWQMLLEAEGYFDRSLEIIPDYLSANQMKSGILAEHYKKDRDLDKLLNGFAEILRVKPNVEYIQQYSEYLNSRGRNTDKLMDFYYRVGYEILASEKRQYAYALKYLNYGLQLDPQDARINLAIGNVYSAAGDPQKANTFIQKAYQLNPALRQSSN